MLHKNSFDLQGGSECTNTDDIRSKIVSCVDSLSWIVVITEGEELWGWKGLHVSSPTSSSAQEWKKHTKQPGGGFEALRCVGLKVLGLEACGGRVSDAALWLAGCSLLLPVVAFVIDWQYSRGEGKVERSVLGWTLEDVLDYIFTVHRSIDSTAEFFPLKCGEQWAVRRTGGGLWEEHITRRNQWPYLRAAAAITPVSVVSGFPECRKSL